MAHPVRPKGGEEKEREENLRQGREEKNQIDCQTWKETKRTKERGKKEIRRKKRRERGMEGENGKTGERKSLKIESIKKVANLGLKILIVGELMSS